MASEMQIEKLNASENLRGTEGRVAGRVLVHYQGTYIGYLTEDDDGTTGTCRGITRRRGTVASALRS